MTSDRFTVAPKGERPVELRILVSRDVHRALAGMAQALGMSSSGYARTIIYNQIAKVHALAEKD
ncbi:hypothetical protein ACQKQD_17955 [Methylobacterium sp. NPDC080182]|uniref:hypothetical protein n=1 Tax=Methylobacterium sp. NPDC080182 TaxID=3390590 RepID=UPI003D02C83C